MGIFDSTPPHASVDVGSPQASDLFAVIRQVRRRWRLKVAARGLAAFCAFGMGAVLLSAYALELLKFTPAAIVGFRVLVVAVWLGLSWRFLARPLLRRANDERVALYLEEHEPSLQAALVSAVQGSKQAAERGAGTPVQTVSPALVRRLVEQAIEKCDSSRAGQAFERRELGQYAAAVTAVVVMAAAALFLGPAYLRHGTSALFLLSRSVSAASPYRIDVKPGDATVPRGSDQIIAAALVGFESEQVELLLRKAPTVPFERLPFVRNNSGAFEAMLFDVAGPMDYFAEAAGVRSPLFRLDVVDLPYVQRLELEYHFPAYTGLPPQQHPNGGDIVVLKGTEVRLRAFPTIPSPSGSVLVNDSTPVALARDADGSLTGRFIVERDGFYRIELEGPRGERVAASPQYTIDVITDQPPSIVVLKPGRDTRASPLEEAFVQIRASDDYGVRELRLMYAVNGGKERTIRLFGGQRALPEVTAGHTFYLEELGVRPGDFVSYYATAKDGDGVAGQKSSTSDLYFMQIRPFNKEFRPATSQGGAMGGSGGQVGALSQQQRQIISATFNVVRDRKTYSAEKFREHVVLIALAQARLREQVESLVQRMNSRLVGPDPSFSEIAEILPAAVVEMRAAEGRLQEQKPDGALPPEQRALTHLQKAEERYELEISTSRNSGGGGAGSIAEDLADLFELEMDKLANQYETMERAEQEGADQQLDELMERLKELARRQEQEAERQRRRAGAGQAGQGGGAGQRALADQAEEAARRLERLSRDQARPDLMDAARRLREAAEAMRRAAANGDPNAARQAAAALERPRDAERRLGQSRAARGERDIRDAIARAEELARDQREIAEQVSRLGENTAERDERVGRLSERKDALEGKVADLERKLDGTSADLQRSQREAARKLQDAARAIRDNKLKEKIRYSKGVIREGSPDQARSFEESIDGDIASLRDTLGQAAGALGRSKGDAMAEALEQARRLARGLESFDQRLRERTDRGSNGRQSDAARSGNAGESSQPSDQGQPGRPSQSGRNAGNPTVDGRGGEGDTVGPWSAGGGSGSRRPGDFTGEEIRQYRGEIRDWRSEAEALRGQLKSEGLDLGDLDEIIRGLRALDNDRVYRDSAELERLQTFVVEGLKRFEYGLRRRVESGDQTLVLSGSDEVPTGYRDLVEEYYRQLSRQR